MSLCCMLTSTKFYARFFERHFSFSENPKGTSLTLEKKGGCLTT
jgi:hypothetical protein